MCEPFSLGAIFASVGSAFKFADLAIRVAEVGSENEVFVRTIRVVRDDLNEVERLLNTESVLRKITSIPGKLPWIKGAVINTKSALNEIGKWVEHARAEQESTGSIRFETRVRWVFNDHEKLLNRKTELSTCHQQLSNVLSYLLRLEDIPATSEPPEYIDSTFFDDVLSRHKRKTVLPAPDGGHRLEQSPRPVANTAKLSENTVTARRLSPPAPFAVDASRSQSNIDLTKVETWPDGPPCSPPPTYTSVVTSSIPPAEAHPYKSSSGALTTSGIDASRDHKPRGLFCKNDDKSRESQGIWAYQYDHNAASVPELAGSTVYMSGTNSLGPVNPFEFAPGPCAQATTSESKDNKPKHLVEMLGSLNFAVELPANDPGPPPGYPSRSKELKWKDSADTLPVNRAYPYSHQASVTEHPTAPRRRPVTLHASTDPGRSPPYSTRPAGLEPPSVYPSKVRSVTAPYREESNCFELPSSFHNTPTTVGPYRAHSFHQSISSDIAPTPLVFSSLAPASSHNLPTMNNAIYDTQKHAESTRTRSHGTQLQPQNQIATGRMRRQKDMMDLLGSLES